MFIVVKRGLNELLWQTKKLCDYRVTRLTGFSEAKKIFKVNLAIQFLPGNSIMFLRDQPRSNSLYL